MYFVGVICWILQGIDYIPSRQTTCGFFIFCVWPLGCVNYEVNGSQKGSDNNNATRSDVNACHGQLFPKLCDSHPVNNDYWILHTTGCNVILHSTTSQLQQVISLEKCQTIYKCWLIYDNTSVCLYLSAKNNQAQPAKRLLLYVLRVQQGKWAKPKYGIQHIFTTPFHVGAVSSSAALYEVVSEEKGKTAKFYIGAGRRLWRMTLLLDSLSAELDQPSPICERGHRIVQVLKVGTNNMMISCDNQIVLINVKLRTYVLITPSELRNASLHSAKSFLSKSGETAFLTVKSQGSIINCFIFLDIQNSSSYCKVVQNNDILTVTDGVFIDDKFLGLLNHTSIVIMNKTTPVYGTIIANICPASNCYLYRTEKLLYIYNQHITTILDKETYKIVTIQNASIYKVLLIVEDAYRNCNELIPSPTPIINVPITSTSLVSDSPSFTPSSTTGIDISRFTEVTSITSTSVVKTTFLSTTSTTTYVTATPITKSSPIAQGATATANANVQESTLPPHNITAVNGKVTSIVIPVVILSIFLLLILIYCCCCHESVKDKYSLNSKNLLMQMKPAYLSTHYYFESVSQERRHARIQL